MPKRTTKESIKSTSIESAQEDDYNPNKKPNQSRANTINLDNKTQGKISTPPSQPPNSGIALRDQQGTTD